MHVGGGWRGRDTIEDLQASEVVVAEIIDRISRLPLPEAERLIKTIRAKGHGLLCPASLICPNSSSTLRASRGS